MNQIVKHKEKCCFQYFMPTHFDSMVDFLSCDLVHVHVNTFTQEINHDSIADSFHFDSYFMEADKVHFGFCSICWFTCTSTEEHTNEFVLLASISIVERRQKKSIDVLADVFRTHIHTHTKKRICIMLGALKPNKNIRLCVERIIHGWIKNKQNGNIDTYNQTEKKQRRCASILISSCDSKY